MKADEEIKELKKSIFSSTRNIIAYVTMLFLFTITFYDYTVKEIQPTNFRVLIILLLAILYNNKTRENNNKILKR